MCMVLPLRLGIFLVAIFTVVWSAALLLFPSFAESMVIFTGGYCLKSRVALGIAEFTGIVFGICGILGCWYCKRNYVMTFNCWQAYRILTFGYVYYVDVPLLNKCEWWVNDIDEMIKEHGWNDLMYRIAMAAVCDVERARFWVFSIASLLLLCYVFACTHRYLEEVGKVPKHLLRIPKDLTSGAWYSHSLGEKQHMNGLWNTGIHPPAEVANSGYGAAHVEGQAALAAAPFGGHEHVDARDAHV